MNTDTLWVDKLTSVYWIFGVISVGGTMLYTLIVRLLSNNYQDWQLAYGPLTLLNTTYSPNYEVIWFYQSFSMACIGVHFVTLDLITASILAHISFQFRILQNNIRRMVINSYLEMRKDTGILSENALIDFDVDGSKIPWKYLENSLKQTVDYHLAILTLASEMEIVFSKLLLLVFLGTLGMLCFLIYNSSLPQNETRLLRYIGETVSTCLQVLTVCFWGEQVVSESQKVGETVTESNFVGTDLRFQKGLILIIRRSQNPTKLTAGKFADICLTTFTWILRTSYSAFMVLTSNKQ